MKEAFETYQRADATNKEVRFGAESARQLAIIIGGEPATWAMAEIAADVVPTSVPEDPDVAMPGRVDQRRVLIGDFWSRSDAGDRALTRLIAAADDSVENDGHRRDARGLRARVRHPIDLVATTERDRSPPRSPRPASRPG